jgi:hypothetical protein
LTGPFEEQLGENRKESTCPGMWTSAFLVRATLRGFESNEEAFELGQHGEASNHRLGWNVPRMRDVPNGKMSNVSGGKK